MDEQLRKYFEKCHIQFDSFQHKAVFTVAESKDIKKEIPGLSTKNLFLKDENNQAYLVCLPAEKRLSIKQIKEFFSIKELHFCNEEELFNELHVRPGSVSLFAMIHAKNTILILDKEIWDAKSSGFHPNVNTATLVIDHKNLEIFYNSLKAKKFILPLE